MSNLQTHNQSSALANPAQSYFENGFFLAKSIINDAALIEVEREFLTLIREYVKVDSIQDQAWVQFSISHPDVVARVYDRFRDSPIMLKLGQCAPLLALIKSIIPSNAGLYKKIPFRIDVPFVTKELAFWHQDDHYVQGNEDEFTAWIPMQNTSISEGCLAVMPASHRLGKIKHDLQVGKKNMPSAIYDREVRLIEMKRGDVLLFSSYTLHSSQLNFSEHIRYSIQLRYTNMKKETSQFMGGAINV